MHSAAAPELGWPFSWKPELACCGGAGCHVGGKLSHSCPWPQVPSIPRMMQAGPGVAANEHNNTVVCMEPLAVCEVTPSSRPGSLQFGQGSHEAPGFSQSHRLIA